MRHVFAICDDQKVKIMQSKGSFPLTDVFFFRGIDWVYSGTFHQPCLSKVFDQYNYNYTEFV